MKKSLAGSRGYAKPLFMQWLLGVTVLGAMALGFYWFLSARNGDIGSAFPPIQVLADVFWLRLGDLASAARFSAEVSALGLLVGTCVGCGGALVVRLASPVDFVVTPLAVVAKATPIVALSPFLAILLRVNSYLIPFASSVLVSFFPVYVLCRRGLRVKMRPLAEYLDSLGIGSMRRLLLLDGFGAMALGGAAMQSAAPLAVVGTLVGEMLVASQGLGFLVVRYQNASNFAALYCAIAVTGIVGVAFFAFGTGIAAAVAHFVGLRAED